MNYYKSFDPAILLGDRLGLSLYGMFVEAYLCGNYTNELQLYEKFISSFPGEHRIHTGEKFVNLINEVKNTGFNPCFPVYANPHEHSLVEGSHRCAIAIQLGVSAIPYNLRFQDDRVDNSKFEKIFSDSELRLIRQRQIDYIDRCPPEIAFRCRVRAIMRNAQGSFQAPFSSRTKIPCLRPYQSLESAGIHGKRLSAKRLQVYELEKYLNRSMIGLEIGCNVGFFSVQIAPLIRHLEAFDIDRNYIEIACLAQRYLCVENCSFTVRSLREFHPTQRYDLVIATAVHGWSGLSFPDFVTLIDACTAPGGLILFESHEIDAEKDWLANRHYLLENFKLIESGFIDDVDEAMYASEMREFLLLSKSSTR